MKKFVVPASLQPSLLDDSEKEKLYSKGPIATIDIGSNSVRLVVYDTLARSLTPLFNEKVMCGLGRKVTLTGLLSDDAMEKALKALRRFRVLCQTMGVVKIFALATAAARDAKNGPAFIEKAQDACGCPIELISGAREALLSGYGIVSGFHHPDGIMGDMGGGSLELAYVKEARVGTGVSLPLGSLALQDASGGSLKKSEKIIRDLLEHVPFLELLEGRRFYAIGGTWRALMRLHMEQNHYPLRIMHGYAVDSQDLVPFLDYIQKNDLKDLESIESISEVRQESLVYGAVLLNELIRLGKPREIVISAMGVREGRLYEMLPTAVQQQDPLLIAAREVNALRSRSPKHGEELILWTDQVWQALSIDETLGEKRLRHAACLLADVSWRAHPDYRGEQSLNIIAHGAFVGIDHAGRAFLALAVYFRQAGLSLDDVGSRLRGLVSPQLLEKARLLGAVMRVAYIVSASMPNILPRTPLTTNGKELVLDLPDELADLGSERLLNRLKQFAKLVQKGAVIRPSL
jgi:exopolyphosphatase / guanosine-5'-triphosphate,3'-diphosphate pyrophosphatase